MRPKPDRWGFDRSLVAPEWQWFWDHAIIAMPFWEYSNRLEQFNELAFNRRWWVSDDLDDPVGLEMANGRYGPTLYCRGSGNTGDIDGEPVNNNYALQLRDANRFTFLIAGKLGTSVGSRNFWFGQSNGSNAVQIERGASNGTAALTMMKTGTFMATADNILTAGEEFTAVLGRNGTTGGGHEIYYQGELQSLTTNNTSTYATPVSDKILFGRTTPTNVLQDGEQFHTFNLLDCPPSPWMAKQFHEDPFGMYRRVDDVPAWLPGVVPPTGGLVGPLAGQGGLAGHGGLAGRRGGLAG